MAFEAKISPVLLLVVVNAVKELPLREVSHLPSLSVLDGAHLAPGDDQHHGEEEGGEDGHGNDELKEREAAGSRQGFA